ncbi:MAG: transcriptional regulator [Patescibacteria group bacterium]|nr:transcriptional regulator [Patescibacteria group bacterium]
MAKEREQLVHELNLAVQRQGTLTVLFTHAIAQHIGLSAAEFEFCDVLQCRGRMPAGQLAKALGLSTGGVTGMVDRLEKAGLVRRVADPNDRRRVIVEPIERGDYKKTIGELYGPLSQAFEDLMASYSDAEIATILDYTNRVGDMMERLQADLNT